MSLNALLIIPAVIVGYSLKYYAQKYPSTEEFLSRSVGNRDSWIATRMLQAAQGMALQAAAQNPMATFRHDQLKGQFIVLSGGNSGIGYETAKSLTLQGADVVIIGRNEKKVNEAVKQIKQELHHQVDGGISLDYIVSDMSDLDSVKALVVDLQRRFYSRKIDQLILNAGVWPSEYAVSKQGYEIAFATNTLGPHLLLRGLIQQDVLKSDARVISVTGDIYLSLYGTKNEECTTDFKYNTPAGHDGEVAYCRSKLGMMWLFDIMHQRNPSLQMYLVHPGVMDNTLSGPNPLPKFLLTTNEQGAQTTLVCATAERKLLENGAYYHNSLGKLVLTDRDPAKNTVKGAAFFELAEGLVAPYLKDLAKK